MRKLINALVLLMFLAGCSQNANNNKQSNLKEEIKANDSLAALFNNYYEQRMHLFPREATANGDNRFNDLLPVDFTDSYRQTLRSFFSSYNDSIAKFNRESLNENDQISYDIFKYEMAMSLEGLYYHDNYTPANQFYGLPLTLGQMGSGEGDQPFKTIEDYDNWLKRAAHFPEWTDSAIIYFKKGIDSGWVLPKALVIKMIPQMTAMETNHVSKSIFYGPINKMPADFSDSDKKRLKSAYEQLITQQLIPSYKKLADFYKKEYLPKARTTTGISAVKDGDAYYRHLVRYWTTTNETPDEIYNTGISEVKRIRAIMDSVKNVVGFKGDLNAFFNYMRTDKKFFPFKTPEDVLNAFRAIQKTVEPHLKDYFGHVPKSRFEIRQTEAFRAASSSIEYNPGTADGSRPGIFYIPIVNASQFNTTSGMESTFLHESIPGHHYQISLQQENTSLPKFRRYSWYGAYGEGWALYCESMGKELGLYTDPYQYMGALGDEIHRAIRLVVDVAMHTKGMTREEAIKYSMENEPYSEDAATAEIERYMAIPAQALSYKIGALKIRELRNKYQQQLGSKFRLSDFHDEFLKDGCMPLEIVEKKMDAWAASIK
jgi:uncharacterized protein (DUF885 family)